MGENGISYKKLGEDHCNRIKPGEPLRTHFIVWEGIQEVGAYFEQEAVKDFVKREINPRRFSVDRIEIYPGGSIKLSQTSGKDLANGGMWGIPLYSDSRLRRVLEEKNKILDEIRGLESLVPETTQAS
jgi:hypothetical protein